jgi:hypothetical protein
MKPTLSVERLEPRDVPALFAVGSETGATAALIDSDTGATELAVSPFDGFSGGTTAACGDMTGDGVADLIVGAAAGGGPHVKMYDGVSGKVVREWMAFDVGFTGGVAVACGDVNDDGIADVVTAAGRGGGPHVKVFDGATGKTLREWMAYDVGFAGGVSLTVGDVNGDNRADVITGARAGGGPHVKAVSVADGRELLNLMAYAAEFRGGVNVSTGDFDRDGRADVLTGSGEGGGPHVRCFGPDGKVMMETMLGDAASGTGIRVGCAAGGPTGDLLLAAVPGSNTVTAYDGIGGAVVSSFTPFGDTAVTVSGPMTSPTDPVLLWNDVTLRAIRADRAPPPRASRALAMVSAAVFDAVNAIERKYQAYLPQPTAPAGASAEAAAITAAYRTVAALFPAQAAKFESMTSAQLSALPDAGKADGVAVGEAAAAAILANRTNDLPASPPYTPGTDPGDWRPTPPANAAFLLPGWGGLKPFAMTRGDQFRPAAPPSLTSAEYTAAYDEVKQLGGATGSTRTADQTEIAQFWAAGGGTETPPGMNNRIAAEVAGRRKLSLVDSARVFALLNLAEADAAVVAWDAKREYDYWRPITAIREGEADGNPATAGDSTWTPLIATPPFPAYTSGHSTFSAAGAAVLTALFGDVAFTTWSGDLPGVARSFPNFTAAAEEAGMSRIYGGIHYQFDNTYGLSSGRQLGEYVAANFLRPV